LGCVSSNSKAMLMFSKAFPFALPHKFTSNEAEFKHMSLSESENHLRMFSVAILVLFLASCFWNWMQFTHENSACAGRHYVVKRPWSRQLLRESHPYIHRNRPLLLHPRAIWMTRWQGVAREDRRTKTNHFPMSASLLRISTSVDQAQQRSFSDSLDFFHGRSLCSSISFNRLLNRFIFVDLSLVPGGKRTMIHSEYYCEQNLNSGLDSNLTDHHNAPIHRTLT
jgi:hypothetical protein